MICDKTKPGNICIPSDCEKIYESNDDYAYIICSNDKFIEMICNMYNIKLCLCIHKDTNIQFVCMYHYDNYVENVCPFYEFLFRVVAFKHETSNQSILMYYDFLNKHDSFQINVDKCVESLKSKIVRALRCGFNKLKEYGINDDFGTLPCGSSENEIMMKMELMGFK